MGEKRFSPQLWRAKRGIQLIWKKEKKRSRKPRMLALHVELAHCPHLSLLLPLPPLLQTLYPSLAIFYADAFSPLSLFYRRLSPSSRFSLSLSPKIFFSLLIQAHSHQAVNFCFLNLFAFAPDDVFLSNIQWNWFFFFFYSFLVILFSVYNVLIWKYCNL